MNHSLTAQKKAIVSYLRSQTLDSIILLAESQVSLQQLSASGILVTDTMMEEIHALLEDEAANMYTKEYRDKERQFLFLYIEHLLKALELHPKLLYGMDNYIAEKVCRYSYTSRSHLPELRAEAARYYFFSGRSQGEVHLNAQNSKLFIEGKRFTPRELDTIKLVVEQKLYATYEPVWSEVSYKRWLGDVNYFKNVQVSDTLNHGMLDMGNLDDYYRRQASTHTFTKTKLILRLETLVLDYRREMSNHPQGLRLLEGIQGLIRGLKGHYELQQLQSGYNPEDQVLPDTQASSVAKGFVRAKQEDKATSFFEQTRAYKSSEQIEQERAYAKKERQDILRRRKERLKREAEGIQPEAEGIQPEPYDSIVFNELFK